MAELTTHASTVQQYQVQCRIAYSASQASSGHSIKFHYATRLSRTYNIYTHLWEEGGVGGYWSRYLGTRNCKKRRKKCHEYLFFCTNDYHRSPTVQLWFFCVMAIFVVLWFITTAVQPICCQLYATVEFFVHFFVFVILHIFLKMLPCIAFMFIQTQYLIQECATLIAKPNFVSVLCYALDNPLHQQKVPVVFFWNILSCFYLSRVNKCIKVSDISVE